MNKKKLSTLFKNGGLFLLLIWLTFYFILKDNQIGNILSVIENVNIFYIFIGIACMFLFICCEANNTRRSLIMFGYETNIRKCLKYAFVGFFFSSVTPSASGGQPMQVYYMHNDKIEISHSVLALLMELAHYQTVTVALALIGFFSQYAMLQQTLGSVSYFLLVGVLLNSVVLVLILTAIFSKHTASYLIDCFSFVLHKFHCVKAKILIEKMKDQLREYQASAVYFSQNKGTMFKILLTTCVQIIALHSIPFWVYKAFGLSSYSICSVIALQAVLYITVSALPLPGAVGIVESGFMVFYKSLFPTSVLSGAMILSRGISFYLFVLISGTAILVHCIYIKRNVFFKTLRNM